MKYVSGLPYTILVTTIQKMGHFIKHNAKHPIYDKRVVLIFDECHRSQFGELHDAIEKKFKKYNMFGFTGTPIYAKNKHNGKNKLKSTTAQVFGDQLHAYTIVDAIRDNNVLPFSVDYIDTFKMKENIKDEKVIGIDTEEVLLAPERISNNVSYLLDHYNQKTKRHETYTNKGKIMKGFNSLFACDSIQMAMLYYSELKKQIKDRGLDLKIATIYSYAANAEEEQFDTSGLTTSHRDFLEDAIRDYNINFGTNYDTSSKEFYNYYIDLTKRIKNNEVDITIVVNMLLTGFDSPITDVLWVDKKLEMHGLIQAFSRTNRILNSIKTFGKIVCFRNLKNEVDEALALYGNKNANGIVIIRPFLDYLNGFDDKGTHHKGYSELVDEINTKFPLPLNLASEIEEQEFIKLYGAILKMRNILTSFDEFGPIDSSYINQRDLQNYQSSYLDLRDQYKNKLKGSVNSIYDNVVFETELAEQIEINIDYILMLIKKYYDSNCQDTQLLADITLAITSNAQLRSKKQLIEDFYNSTNIDTNNIGDSWKQFVNEQMESDLNTIIKDEKLKEQETKDFMQKCMEEGELRTSGSGISSLLPPLSRFSNNRAIVKQRVIDKLQAFVEKFKNL